MTKKTEETSKNLLRRLSVWHHEREPSLPKNGSASCSVTGEGRERRSTLQIINRTYLFHECTRWLIELNSNLLHTFYKLTYTLSIHSNSLHYILYRINTIWNHRVSSFMCPPALLRFQIGAQNISNKTKKTQIKPKANKCVFFKRITCFLFLNTLQALL